MVHSSCQVDSNPVVQVPSPCVPAAAAVVSGVVMTMSVAMAVAIVTGVLGVWSVVVIVAVFVLILLCNRGRVAAPKERKVSRHNVCQRERLGADDVAEVDLPLD